MEVNTILHRILVEKKDYEQQLLRHNESHCTEAVQSFRNTLLHALATSPPHEKVIRIPFMHSCGSYIKQFLEKEQIPHHVSVRTTLHESNQAVIFFDTEQSHVSTMLGKSL
jgi:hypothetical protein